MKIRLITDSHSGKQGYCQGQLCRLGNLAEDLIKDFIKTSNSDSDTSLVVQLGDLIEDSSAEEDEINYTKTAELFHLCTKQVYHILGNHDYKLLPEHKLQRILNKKNLTYFIDYQNYRFVFLRVILHDDKPVLAEPDIRILEDGLSTASQPVVIFSHFPFSEHDLSNNKGWHAGNLHRALVTNRLEIRKIITDSKKVLCCVNGHLHANYHVIHDGIPYFTIQSSTDNFKNDGTPAAAHAELILSEENVHLIVHGNDPAEIKYSKV